MLIKSIILSLLWMATAAFAENVPFNVVAEGGFSGIDEPVSDAVLDQARYDELWMRHTAGQMPEPAQPGVDFVHHTLLVAFAGLQASSGSRLSLIGVEADNAELRVHVMLTSPGKHCISNSVMGSPYIMVTIPQSKLPVRFISEDRIEDCADP